MVEIATCSYNEFRPEMGVPVRASLGLPRYALPYTLHPDAKVWEITPRRDYLNASDEVYESRFIAQLELAGVDGIEAQFRRVSRIVGAEPLVILCFEKLGAKTHSGIRAKAGSPMTAEALICHRRLFAQWWERKTGISVPELGSRLDHSHVARTDTPPEPLALF